MKKLKWVLIIVSWLIVVACVGETSKVNESPTNPDPGPTAEPTAVPKTPPNPTPEPTAVPPSTQPFEATQVPVYTNPGGQVMSSGSGVAPGVSISVTFSSDINASTAVANSTSQYTSVAVTYKGSNGNQASMPNLNLAVSGNVLTITAVGGFYGGTLFDLTINGLLKDVNGQSLSPTVSSSFSTSGSTNNIQVQISFDYNFSSTTINKFTYSYGIQSGSYPAATSNITFPYTIPTGVSGITTISGTLALTLDSETTYYISVAACMASGECSGSTSNPNPETIFYVP